MLEGKRIYLRYFEEKDIQEILEYRVKNVEFFQNFSPKFGDDYCTLEGVENSIKRHDEEKEKDQNYTFGIFLKETNQLIGDISAFKIERGPAQKCMIGYQLDKSFNGMGYMSEATPLMVEFLFKELKFHRIEAGAKPDNIGSNRILQKAGFHEEGIERQGVKINGKWEDHRIYAIINDDHTI